MDWKQVGRESWQWHQKEKAGMRFPSESVAGQPKAGQAPRITGDGPTADGDDGQQPKNGGGGKATNRSDAGGASG